MKKIVILTHSFPPIVGGGESHAYTLSKLLAIRGYAVHVITGTIPKEFKRKRPKLRGVKLYEIQQLRELSLGLVGFRTVAAQLHGLLNKINL